MLEEVSACDDRIRNLKRDLQQAQDDEDQMEVGDCRQRLGYYHQLSRDVEAQLFGTGTHA